jgi:ribosomal protein S18 acetylase RimI-like enzyme
MKTQPVIRHMRKQEMGFVIDLAYKEGWNPGINDEHCFYNSYPDGFFIMELNSELIGCISAIAYDNAYGFIGFYIVVPEYRGKGFGLQLWNHGMQYLGNRNIGLDGVVEQQQNYEKSGFKFAYNNIRYGFNNLGTYKDAKAAFVIEGMDFNELNNFDKQIFPTEREQFLNYWIYHPQHISIGIRKDKEMCGYIVLRNCREGYKIGPAFAENEKIADTLISSALSKIPQNEKIFIDIPETNKHAVELIDKYKMEKVFETARMYTNNEPEIIREHIFGVTTFELG